jgi:hypothetical protein
LTAGRAAFVRKRRGSPRPTLAKTFVESDGAELRINIPRRVWNEFSFLALSISSLFSLVGSLGFITGIMQQRFEWAAIGPALLVVSITWGLITMRNQRRVSILCAPGLVAVQRTGTRRAEYHPRHVSLEVRSGRAWEVGAPIRWYDLHREFTIVYLRCGHDVYRLLDGATEKEKTWVASHLVAWLEDQREAEQS